MDTHQILDDNFYPEEDNREEIELLNGNNFIILFLLSLGLYGVWWMYKSWKFFKDKNRLSIMPAARALFAIIFAYSLFEVIQQYAASKGYSKTYSSSGLFVLFIFLNILGNLPDPYWMVSFLSFLCLMPPFHALNYAISHSDRYRGVERKGFNNRQLVIVVMGGLLWLLILAGLLLPEEGI